MTRLPKRRLQTPENIFPACGPLELENSDDLSPLRIVTAKRTLCQQKPADLMVGGFDDPADSCANTRMCLQRCSATGAPKSFLESVERLRVALHNLVGLSFADPARVRPTAHFV